MDLAEDELSFSVSAKFMHNLLAGELFKGSYSWPDKWFLGPSTNIIGLRETGTLLNISLSKINSEYFNVVPHQAEYVIRRMNR